MICDDFVVFRCFVCLLACLSDCLPACLLACLLVFVTCCFSCVGVAGPGWGFVSARLLPTCLRLSPCVLWGGGGGHWARISEGGARRVSGGSGGGAPRVSGGWGAKPPKFQGGSGWGRAPPEFFFFIIGHPAVKNMKKRKMGAYKI